MGCFLEVTAAVLLSAGMVVNSTPPLAVLVILI